MMFFLVMMVAVTSQLVLAVATLTPYNNPIISGFAPDPSCVRVEEQFFCVSSSFSAFPGIPVYTSRDLVQWQQIGNVLSRPEQLPALSTINTTTGGIWASTIRHHDGTFYVTTTLVKDNEPVTSQERWDNLIFTNDDIWSNDGNGWSDPVHFTFMGYDTSPFWDDDGTVYIQGSHYWKVLPGIQQFSIDLATGSNLSDPIFIWNGTGGIAPEGPHIYKRDDGYYYLLIAEGGTGLAHMVTMARSPNITGPFESYANNPVLTNANTSLYLQTVGHADVFNDTNGNHWAVSLATRNGTVNYPMGRETVLVPVVWDEGDFPVFNNATPGHAYINMSGPLPPPRLPTDFDTKDPLVGHPQSITFEPNSTLPRQLLYYRLPDFSRFTVSPDGHPNTLRIMGSAENITGSGGIGTSTFVARRQDALLFTAEATLDFDLDLDDSSVEGEEAGMTLFIQRTKHFDLGITAVASAEDGSMQRVIQLRTVDANSSADGFVDPLSEPGKITLSDDSGPFRLRVQAVNASTYVFAFADASKLRGEIDINATETESGWTIVGYGAASEVSGGFTGTLVGMYATGNGRNASTAAYFSSFDYVPVQGVY